VTLGQLELLRLLYQRLGRSSVDVELQRWSMTLFEGGFHGFWPITTLEALGRPEHRRCSSKQIFAGDSPPSSPSPAILVLQISVHCRLLDANYLSAAALRRPRATARSSPWLSLQRLPCCADSRDQNRQPPMHSRTERTTSRDSRTYSRSELLRGALA